VHAEGGDRVHAEGGDRVHAETLVDGSNTHPVITEPLINFNQNNYFT
jgi:hypothetical protein